MLETAEINKKRQLWILVFAVFFCVFGMKLLFSDSKKGDFPIYYDSIRQSLEGAPAAPYKTEGYGFVYMPFAYIAMHPMGLFSLKTSRMLHYLVESALLFLTCIMLLRLTLSEGKYLPYLMGAALMLTFRYLHNNIGYGQMNLVVLFSLVAALFFFHRDNKLFSALFMAVAISFKVTPMLFILYFILKKEFRLVLYIIILTLALNFMLPLMLWGMGTGAEVCRAWYGAQFSLGQHNATKLSNYSILSMLYRFFTDYSWSDLPGRNPVNILSICKSAVIGMYITCAVIILAVFVKKYNKPATQLMGEYPRNNTFLAMLPEYSMVVIMMLLFSPVSWQHHFVLLLLPHFYLGWFLLNTGIKNNKAVFYLLLASFIISGLTTPVIIGERLNRVIMNYSAITFGTMLLFAAVLLASSKKHHIRD
jgi:hypothetical protein